MDKVTGSAPSLTLSSIPVVRQPIQQSWYHHPCWSLKGCTWEGVHRPQAIWWPRVDVNKTIHGALTPLWHAPITNRQHNWTFLLVSVLFLSPKNRSLPATHWDTTAEKSQHLLSISWQLPRHLWIPMWFWKGEGSRCGVIFSVGWFHIMMTRKHPQRPALSTKFGRWDCRPWNGPFSENHG